MVKLRDRTFLAVNVIFLAVFLPVLCGTLFVGNSMDYWVGMKLTVLLPGQVLALLALLGMAACICLFRACRKMELTGKKNLVVNLILAALFIVLYFVNVRVAREIAFKLPWDIMVVGGAAYSVAYEEELGYYYYLSMYSNNIPISYILGKILRKAMEMKNYPYVAEFMWLQVNCILISLGGFFSCLTVKKLTGRLMPTVTAFGLYLVLVGISPWKIAPYTDTYGMVFPIMGIYFYVCYKKAEKDLFRYLYLVPAMISIVAGGLVKPSIYVVLIALLAIEFLSFLADRKKYWKFFLTEVLLAAALLFAVNMCKDYFIEEIGLEFNPEIEAGWQNYLYMGLNEKTTGGYNGDDVAIFGEFQTSREERNQAALERAFGRLKDRGFFGSVYFWLKKMMMTFNDGTFGWRSEVWVEEYFPDDLASNTALTQWLRDIFWVDAANMGRYNTLCQLAWYFCITGIPGICLCKKEKREKYGVLALSFLGIFFYQMLFEARARYLLVFLPVLTAISICGICQYTARVTEFLEKRKTGRTDREAEHGAGNPAAEK